MFSKLQGLISKSKDLTFLNIYINMHNGLQKAADFLLVPKHDSPNRVNIFVSSMNKLRSRKNNFFSEQHFALVILASRKDNNHISSKPASCSTILFPGQQQPIV